MHLYNSKLINQAKMSLRQMKNFLKQWNITSMSWKQLFLLVSLATSLASVVAAGCKHAPRVSMSSKSYEHKQKGDLCTVPFLQWIKIPK
jgi:hypothetical protein